MTPEQFKAVKNHILKLRDTLTPIEIKLLDTLIGEDGGYSMLPPSRLLDAYRSARQAARRYPGSSIVEFGVYLGGSISALAFGASIDSFTGNIIGFDTFEGHTVAPRDDELDIHGRSQLAVYNEMAERGEKWAFASIDSCSANIKRLAHSLGFDEKIVNLIKGDARATSHKLYQYARNISLLRLDMDWYEPTIAALDAALPLIQRNGIVIVDDYGHHSGVKAACDQWLAGCKRDYDFSFVDYSCLRITFLG